jgi:hypothetical protein
MDEEKDSRQLSIIEKIIAPTQLPLGCTGLVAIFTVVGIIIAATYYYFYYWHTVEVDTRAEDAATGRTRIYFEGSLSQVDGCRVTIETGQRDCEIEIAPTDKNNRVMNFAVQFPAGAARDGLTVQGSLGGAALPLRYSNDYLVGRAKRFSTRADSFNVVIPLPIIIYSSYEFEGKTYDDRSLYYLLYTTLPPLANGKMYSVPLSILYCGRISQDVPRVDFLIDTWIPTRIGYRDKSSTAIAFGCPQKYAFWVETVRGEMIAKTDLASEVAADPSKKGRSFTLLPRGMAFRPLGDDKQTVKYKLLPIGGPDLPQLPGG